MKSEVTIVGAGVVGMTMAALLVKQNVSVCLIDKKEIRVIEGDNLFSGRTAALNIYSENIFRELNLWNEIERFTTSFNEIIAWDKSGSSKINFKASELGLKNLGYVVSNNALIQALIKQNLSNDLFNFIGEVIIKDIKEENDLISVEIEGKEEIHSNLLIGADGGLSIVREKSNIKSRKWSYNQKAIIANISADREHGNIARQIFTKTGPIALLPFNYENKERISLVWSIDADTAEKVMRLSPDDFCGLLQLNTEDTLGNFKLEEEISSFPLHQLHANKYFNGRSVVIGDAAHTIHPLAGQGLNLGIGDAEELSRLISLAKRKAKNIGSEEVLQQFHNNRFFKNLKMMGLMELFKKGFQSSNPWLKLGRNYIFQEADKIESLKKRLIREAAGI